VVEANCRVQQQPQQPRQSQPERSSQKHSQGPAVMSSFHIKPDRCAQQVCRLQVCAAGVQAAGVRSRCAGCRCAQQVCRLQCLSARCTLRVALPDCCCRVSISAVGSPVAYQSGLAMWSGICARARSSCTVTTTCQVRCRLWHQQQVCSWADAPCMQYAFEVSPWAAED
jgi:hypothetical protein